MAAHIPSYQTLGWRSGWKLQRRSALPYPLSHDRIRTYYLGRNAIYHGAKALGLQAGDEVLFPSYHSGTESAPLLYLGCRLTFYSVARDFSLDLDEIEAKITPDTKALYVIHTFGFPAPIQELRALADRYSLPVIEDVALSLLGTVGGQPLGSWGDISVFCTYKNLPVGTGGILAINREDIPLPAAAPRRRMYSELNLTAKHVLNHLELHGGPLGVGLRKAIQACSHKTVRTAGLQLASPDSLDFDPHILEWDISRFTKTLLRLFDYESIANRRRANYAWLSQRLAGTGVARIRPELPEGAVPLFFPILARDKFATVERLHAENIDAIPVWGIHHPHVPRGEFLDTEFLVEHAVEIPIIQDLKPQHLERIAEAVERLATWPDAPLETSGTASSLALSTV